MGLKQQAQLNVNGNGSSSTTTTAKAKAGFFQFSQAQLASQIAGLNQEPTLGTCVTGTFAGSGSGGGNPVATYLDGGTTITLTPPSGATIAVPSQQTGVYQTGNLTVPFPLAARGFSNGAGGAGVSPVNFNFPIPAQVTWTNETSLSSGPPIDRTQGLLITGAEEIRTVLSISTGKKGQIGPAQKSDFHCYYFDCSAPNPASQLMIPSSILLAMPTGANAFASIQVSTVSFPGHGARGCGIQMPR